MKGSRFFGYILELDITIHKGSVVKPVAIFIHGLGVDKSFWTDPLDTKIFAKNIPLKFIAAAPPESCPVQSRKKLSVGTVPDEIDNLWNAVVARGFNTLCWSQRRPVGPISSAVEELKEIMKRVKRIFPGNTIALIGHSRGGLIARKFMEKKAPEIKALITVASPHAGSSLSRVGKYLSPLAPVLKGMLPKNTHGTVSEIINNIVTLIEGRALRELLPDSAFFKGLQDSPSKGVHYVSFGGTETKLVTVYSWKKRDAKMYPTPLLTIPDSLIKMLPVSVVPDELTPGKGDWLVTAKSSMLPWASRHYNLPTNHFSISWHEKTKSITLGVLEKQ